MIASLWLRFRSRAATAWCGLALIALPGVLGAEPPAETPPTFFDPLATITPGITRELGLTFEHVRDSDDRFSQLSLRLQYPVLSWLQFSLEMPVAFADPGTGSSSTGAGDLVLVGQAMVWIPRSWPAEVDLGLELTLPTGGSDVGAGSTALRPFAAAGTKLGPLDVIGNLSYQWIFDGPTSGTQLFQASLAAGYPVRWIAPFAELIVLKPLRGPEDLRPQVSVLPGIEFFLPGSLSLSLGVQLPLGAARAFDQRVLGFLKWQF